MVVFCTVQVRCYKKEERGRGGLGILCSLTDTLAVFQNLLSCLCRQTFTKSLFQKVAIVKTRCLVLIKLIPVKKKTTKMVDKLTVFFF